MSLIREINRELNSGTREIRISRRTADHTGKAELEEIIRLCKICGVLLIIEGYGKWDFRPANLKRRGGGCFITTACIKAKGLPDNCFELREFRHFRDTYVRNHPDGEDIISEYYKIAPLIVNAINNCENSMYIYSMLYNRLVKNSIKLIHLNRKKDAFVNMLHIYTNLKLKYLNLKNNL